MDDLSVYLIKAGHASTEPKALSIIKPFQHRLSIVFDDGLSDERPAKSRLERLREDLRGRGYFEEMGEGARGFRVYNDETELMDAEMVNGWAGTLDTLFLFVRIT